MITTFFKWRFCDMPLYPTLCPTKVPGRLAEDINILQSHQNMVMLDLKIPFCASVLKNKTTNSRSFYLILKGAPTSN